LFVSGVDAPLPDWVNPALTGGYLSMGFCAVGIGLGWAFCATPKERRRLGAVGILLNVVAFVAIPIGVFLGLAM
jgi:hypothetical protein